MLHWFGVVAGMYAKGLTNTVYTLEEYYICSRYSTVDHFDLHSN